MYMMYLEGTRKVELDKKKALELSYYITEIDEYIADHKLHVYGIKIINKINENGSIHYETELVKGLSYSKDYVQRLLQKLMKHLVTPICMLEIIDDLMSEHYELSS